MSSTDLEYVGVGGYKMRRFEFLKLFNCTAIYCNHICYVHVCFSLEFDLLPHISSANPKPFTFLFSCNDVSYNVFLPFLQAWGSDEMSWIRNKNSEPRFKHALALYSTFPD